MRLLFITQAVDLDDPVLSFAHSWVRELAGRFERVEVICLKEGTHSLPENVRVHSLGKEVERSRLKYVVKLFRTVWGWRHEYDIVLVHQNQEYVLLCGWLWAMLGKRVFMWRNHWAGNIMTDIASLFCAKVFCTSKFSYTGKYEKTVLMPVGVDTDVFTPQRSKQRKDSLLYLGRIAPSKRIDVILQALLELHTMGVRLKTQIYGDALAKDAPYVDKLKKFVKDNKLEHFVDFQPGVPNVQTPALFASHEYFVNCSASGMYDKTIFESCASGAITFASSEDYGRIADTRLFFDGTATALARALKNVTNLPTEEKDRLKDAGRELALRNSLSHLGEKLREEMSA